MPTTSTHSTPDTTQVPIHGRATPATHNPSVGTHRNSVAAGLGRLTPETLVLGIALLALLAWSVTMPAVAALLLGIPIAAVIGIGTISGIARLLAGSA